MKRLPEETVTLSSKKVKELLENSEYSKSSKMKELFNGGHTIKGISELMNVRYNFVYNVISNYVTIESISLVQETKVNKKSLIIDLFNQGKSNKEISIILKTNYNYVFNTLKEYKSSQVNTVNE